MSEWDGFDSHNNENGEVVGESMPTEDTPVAEVVVESETAEENPVADVVVESTPVEKIAPTDAVIPYNNSQYGNNQYGNGFYNPYGGQVPPNGNQGSPYNNNPYNNQYNTPYNNQYNNQYNNTPYNNNQYGNPYNNNLYSNNLYNNNQYNNSQYNNASYENNPYGNNPYGGQIPPSGNQGSPYNNNPYGNQYNNQYNNQNNQYNNQNNQYNNQNNQYNNQNNQYNNQNNQYNNPYSNNPYSNNNPYSPYAVPQKKNKNGLIIGIVIGIVMLFFIAVFALIYRAVSPVEEDNGRTRNGRDEYQFDYDDDDWGVKQYRRDRDPDYDDPYDDDDNDDWHDDYDYNDWYDDYDDSQYYDLHDAIRDDLSYSVDIKYDGYDTDNENMYIWTEYPIIQGGDVPNLDKLNDVIKGEMDSYIKYFEEEYEDVAKDDFYGAYIIGYVTYMDEDKMSIVFDERIYSDYYDDYVDVYLYCINIDMENGVVLENQNMLRIDDDFSVDFRERSDIQNGESYYISMMSDQEITDYFNSTDIIVFYTPMGMEIGFNYEEGWITVTYSEYEQYLKVF